MREVDSVLADEGVGCEVFVSSRGRADRAVVDGALGWFAVDECGEGFAVVVVAVLDFGVFVGGYCADVVGVGFGDVASGGGVVVV